MQRNGSFVLEIGTHSPTAPGNEFAFFPSCKFLLPASLPARRQLPLLKEPIVACWHANRGGLRGEKLLPARLGAWADVGRRGPARPTRPSGQDRAPTASPEIPQPGQPWAADLLPSHHSQVSTGHLAGRQERCLQLGVKLGSAGCGMCCPSHKESEPSHSVSATQRVRVFSVPTNLDIIKMY